ncbi:hypothetical protein CASFOL_019880 [Castilleja foliolosa]|uniref:BHLH transcription factor n=1 Tax=Castilleja foliolosa TaxID=1961234 RepID=A0ABD3CZ81_9LAMI
MVMAEESKTYWNTSYLDDMSFLQPEQNYHKLPFFNLPGLNTGQENAAYRFLKSAPPNCGILNPTENPLIHDPPKKKFLIFDHSGNQTRLFLSSSFSPQYPITNALPASAANAPFGETAARENPEFLSKPMIVEEKWDENHLTDGDDENEMLEDSDEIDALFYSDSDDDDVDNDDDDEVTSPFTTEEGYKEERLLEESTKQLACSDDSLKRRKLLDGNYKNPSRAIISSGAETYSSDDDDIDSDKREKKVKIRQALRMLESIIPGLNKKDPLSVIDNAVNYLKSLRIEAKALGISYPEGKSVISP